MKNNLLIILFVTLCAGEFLETDSILGNNDRLKIQDTVEIAVSPHGTIDSVLGFTTGDKTVRAGVVSVDSVSYADTAGYTIYSDTTNYLNIGKYWASISAGDSIDSIDIEEVCWGNNLFVAVGSRNIITSPDGKTWTMRIYNHGIEFAAVCYFNGIYIAIGEPSTALGDSSVMTSPDGINWTLRSAQDGDWRDITGGNGIAVAVGWYYGANQIMTSPNGVDWTAQSNPQSARWNAVTFFYNNFIAIADDGSKTDSLAMTSTDGVTWQLRYTGTNRILAGITNGNGICIAVSETGDYVLTSSNAVDFTQTAVNIGKVLDVTYGKGVFLAVNWNENNDAKVITSPDGINWSDQILPADEDTADWCAVTYGNDMFVAVANNGDSLRIMTSGSRENNDIPHDNIYQGGMEINGDVLLPDLEPGKPVATNSDTVLSTPDSIGCVYLTTDTVVIGGGSEIIKMEITDDTNDTLEITIGAKTWQFLPIADQ